MCWCAGFAGARELGASGLSEGIFWPQGCFGFNGLGFGVWGLGFRLQDFHGPKALNPETPVPLN